MSDVTDSSADSIPLTAEVNDDAGDSNHDVSFVCAGSFIVVILLGACYVKRLRVYSPIHSAPADAAVSRRSEVISYSVLKALIMRI